MVPGSGASPGFSERPVTQTVQPYPPSAMAMPLPAPPAGACDDGDGPAFRHGFYPKVEGVGVLISPEAEARD